MAFTLIRINHVHPNPTDGAEMSDRYRAALDIAEFLDERGLNAVQLDEHHVSSTGWSPTPMLTAGMRCAMWLRNWPPKPRSRALQMPSQKLLFLTKTLVNLVTAKGPCPSDFD